MSEGWWKRDAVYRSDVIEVQVQIFQILEIGEDVARDTGDGGVAEDKLP